LLAGLAAFAFSIVALYRRLDWRLAFGFLNSDFPRQRALPARLAFAFCTVTFLPGF
jgi:hypothetical protein